MRLPHPWKLGCGRRREDPDRLDQVPSHPVDIEPEDSMCERDPEAESTADVDRDATEDCERSLDTGDVRDPEELREECQETDDVPEVDEGEDGGDEAVSDESPDSTREQPLVSEVHKPHEAMVRGNEAREDAPHPVINRAETRHPVRRPVRAQRAWHLSEPISVERWQSAPHLRSGFSSG